ncbi:MAG TPA: protease complex subunit PrcB family protein [Candidatus Blautia excrementipullorum]|nr:protease complex subunit PrcB family protein [Candidatus Blautia excrementipullorum]
MKKAALLFWIAAVFLMLSGCRAIRIEEAERTPLKYTVVDSSRIPEEAASLIEEKKAAEFQMIYQSGEDMYLIKGYGRQMSGGYSIQVTDLSLSSTAIFFSTKLIGPSKDSQSGEPSYPYIAVKTEYREEPVQFQ